MKNKGPKLTVINECRGCDHLSVLIRLSQEWSCSLLNLVLNEENNMITPHSSCPFKVKNEIAFHEQKLKEARDFESAYIKNIIGGIFSEFTDYKDYLYTLRNENPFCIEFKLRDVYFDELKAFEKKLPDFKISFEAYSDSKFIVRIERKQT